MSDESPLAVKLMFHYISFKDIYVSGLTNEHGFVVF